MGNGEVEGCVEVGLVEGDVVGSVEVVVVGWIMRKWEDV